MAEGVGFEPTMGGYPHAGFQDQCLKPLGHPSEAEDGVGAATRQRTRAHPDRREFDVTGPEIGRVTTF